jgi:hypothetical protein
MWYSIYAGASSAHAPRSHYLLRSRCLFWRSICRVSFGKNPKTIQRSELSIRDFFVRDRRIQIS